VFCGWCSGVFAMEGAKRRGGYPMVVEKRFRVISFCVMLKTSILRSNFALSIFNVQLLKRLFLRLFKRLQQIRYPTVFYISYSLFKL
jgi:hypothetical protein